MRYVVAGLPCFDFIDGAAPKVGGSVVFCARAAHSLGLDVTAQMRGTTTLRREVEKLLPGVDIRWEDADSDTAYVIEHNGSVRHLRLGDHAGQIHSLPELGDDDVLHLAPIAAELSASLLNAVPLVRFRGLTAQGLLRDPRPGADPLDVDFDDTDAWAGVRLDAIVLSESEVSPAAKLLARHENDDSLIVVTDGAHGGRATRGAQEWTYAAHGPEYDFAPVGAGDVFATGLFAGLAQGLDVLDALTQGAQLVDRILRG